MGKFTLISVALIASLAGSTGAPASRAGGLQSVRTITMAHEVPVPKEMMFGGLTEVLGGALGGGLAGGVGAGLGALGIVRKGEPAFEIGEAVRSAMTSEIQRSGRFMVEENGPADSDLRLHVTAYGFYTVGPIARRVRPLLAFQASLMGKDGRVFWKHRFSVTHLNNHTPAHLPEEIKRDPRLGAEALRAAAQICARQAVASLNKK